MTRVLRVAALLRVSTDKVEQEDSPEHQLAYIREEIRRRNTGDEIWIDSGLVYEDELTGALVLERPGIRQLLKDVAAGKIDLVATKSISRLGRDTLGLLALKRRLWDDLGVDLVALQDNYRASRDPELIFLVHADRAQSGRQEISQNVRTALRQKAKRVPWPVGRVPFGYVREGRNRIVPHPETAAIVKLIFELRAAGWGLAAIADHLNNTLQVPAPNWWIRWKLREDRLTELAATDDRWARRLAALREKYERKRPLWSVTTIRDLLQNTAYYGEAKYFRTYRRRLTGGRQKRAVRSPEEHIVVECPPIVDRELWLRAQEVAARRVARGATKHHNTWLLSGLVYCGKCGHRMHGNRIAIKGKPEYRYYFCRQRVMYRACDARGVRADQLEETVVEHVKRELERLKASPPPARLRNEAQDVEARIRELEAALADLKDERYYFRTEHRKGRVSDEELEETLRRLAAKEATLRAQLAEAMSKRGANRDQDLYKRAVAMWEQYNRLEVPSREMLRQLLLAVVERVTVTDDAVNVRLLLTNE